MFIGGLHMIHKKIGAFIFQDVQNPNETKTTAVTLRLYALILSVYFLVLFCVCCFLRDVPSSLLTLICGILYVFAFRITYLNHTHFASIFSQLLTLLWITVFIQRFGWDCGVQHFLFVLLVLNFAVSFHRIRTKIFVGICTVLTACFCIPIHGIICRSSSFPQMPVSAYRP